MKKKVLNVRLPNDLLEILDQFVKESHYNSRSEAIRDFARDFIKGGENAG